MSRVLDDLHRTGHAVAVVRYGRIEAVLAPLEDGPKVGLARSWSADLAPHEEVIDLASIDLDGLTERFGASRQLTRKGKLVRALLAQTHQSKLN